MKISTGTPPADGRYLAFVRCASTQVRDWVEPVVATWHGGKWHRPGEILGWFGPIPAMKVADIVGTAQVIPPPPTSYDL